MLSLKSLLNKIDWSNSLVNFKVIPRVDLGLSDVDGKLQLQYFKLHPTPRGKHSRQVQPLQDSE